MPTVNDLGASLPLHFPKSLRDMEVGEAIRNIQRKIEDCDSDSSLRKLNACLRPLLPFAGKAEATPKEEKPKAAKNEKPQKEEAVKNESPKKEKSEPSKKEKAEPAKKPELPKKEKTETAKKEKAPKKEKEGVMTCTYVHKPEACKRASKKTGLPNIIGKYFDVPSRPCDVAREIIEEYDELEKNTTIAYTRNKVGYVKWYVRKMVSIGRLVEVVAKK